MRRRPSPREVDELRLPTVYLARELSPQLVQAQVASGEWTRVRRGACVATSDLLPGPAEQERPEVSRPAGTPGPPSRPEHATRTAWDVSRIPAVARQVAPDVIFTHDSAATLWGLPRWRSPTIVHINQRSLRSGHASQDVARHSARLDPPDVTKRSGLRVTSLERTVVDCARSSSAPSGLVVADAALRRGVERDALVSSLLSLGAARGVRLARAVVELADAGAESPWESVTRLVLLATGVPAPSTQVPVATRLGTFFVDMGWEHWKVALEFDGLVKYTTLASGDRGRVIFDEKRRHDAIVEAGWRMLRVTRADLRPPEGLRERLRRVVPTGALDRLRPLPHLLHGL
ncbi:hypothetical protein [Sanguibacter sp. 26GB23]|uniref:hypothetical protein n=1 Tax=Sanguibacter sp. 26GB23 TaxID=3156066 RepID=UPI0032AEF2DC